MVPHGDSTSITAYSSERWFL